MSIQSLQDLANEAQTLATGKVMPTTTQQNPPGIDFPADAVPGSTVRRQDAINP